MHPPDRNPEVEGIITEMDALNACLRALTNESTAATARKLVGRAWMVHPEGTTVDSYVTRVAMADILGLAAPMPLYSGTLSAWERVAIAWTLWLHGSKREAEALLREAQEAGDEPHDGAVHRMALQHWMRAIQALLRGEREEARRLFQRAADLGSSFGTESHPVVLWTMAASFFPKPAAHSPTPTSGG